MRLKILWERVALIYGEFGFEALKVKYSIDIKTNPEYLQGPIGINKIQSLLDTLRRSIDLLFNSHEDILNEIDSILEKSDNGFIMRDPEKAEKAEFVFRNLKKRIIDVCAIMRAIYVNAGYEDPFSEMDFS